MCAFGKWKVETGMRKWRKINDFSVRRDRRFAFCSVLQKKMPPFDVRPTRQWKILPSAAGSDTLVIYHWVRSGRTPLCSSRRISLADTLQLFLLQEITEIDRTILQTWLRSPGCLMLRVFFFFRGTFSATYFIFLLVLSAKFSFHFIHEIYSSFRTNQLSAEIAIADRTCSTKWKMTVWILRVEQKYLHNVCFISSVETAVKNDWYFQSINMKRIS